MKIFDNKLLPSSNPWTIFKVALLNHLQQLLLDFDPVKDGLKVGVTKEELLYSKLQHQQKSISSSAKVINSKVQVNLTYLLPAASLMAISLESQAIYLASAYQRRPELLNSLIARRIFPPSMWAQSDVMLQLGLLMATSLVTCLLLTPKLEGKFLMYLFQLQKMTSEASEEAQFELIQNGHLLGAPETALIVNYRTRMNRRIRWAILTLFSMLVCFYFYSFFFLTWSTSAAQNYFKLVELILLTAYLPLVNVYMIFYFLLVVRYIRIKQGCLQERIFQLESVVVVEDNLKEKEVQKGGKLQSPLLSSFKALNADLATIHEEIRGHNRYWSKLLSIIFAIYIMEICFFFYTVLFNSNSEGATTFGRFVFATFGLEFLVLLLFITLECSKVVASNRRTHRQLGRIAVIFSHSKRLLNLTELLKLDQAAARGRDVASVCFKLVNGYRINSQMFQLIFYYTSLFFMMIFRRQNEII